MVELDTIPAPGDDPSEALWRRPGSALAREPRAVTACFRTAIRGRPAKKRRLSNLGRLYKVDAATGVATLIDLHGSNVVAGDGILLDGKTLYVVQNQLNRVAVVRLSPDLTSGQIVRYLTDPRLDVPTTIDEHGNRLYAVNARFTTPPTPSTPYSVVQLRK